MATNEISAEVEEAATGDQLLSPETHIAKLKDLNVLLIEDTMEHRLHIHKLHKIHSKLVSLATDHDILDVNQLKDYRAAILSSKLFDAAARSAAEMAEAMKTVEEMLRKFELASEELNAVEMRLLAVTTEKDEIVRDFKRVADERDLTQSDLDAKKKKVTDLEKSVQTLEDRLALGLKEKEVADAKCVNVDSLKAANKENAVKMSALIEKNCFLEESKGKLEKKVEELEELWRYENEDWATDVYGSSDNDNWL